MAPAVGLEPTTNGLTVRCAADCATPEQDSIFFGKGWCREGDLNPHGVTHTPLKRARLPVPPSRRLHSSPRTGWDCSHPGEWLRRDSYPVRPIRKCFFWANAPPNARLFMCEIASSFLFFAPAPQSGSLQDISRAVNMAAKGLHPRSAQ